MTQGISTVVHGPLLIPQAAGHRDGRVTYHAEGILAADGDGMLTYAGAAAGYQGPGGTFADSGGGGSENGSIGSQAVAVRRADGVMLPPLLDIHTHIPQHPIRGRFTEGVADDAPEGRLLAGLKRNVFPAEVRCAQEEYARDVVGKFYTDTLTHGVVGGASYMTTSPIATRVALEMLPETWQVGLVLMNQNCPDDIHTDAAALDRSVAELAERFGQRLIVTDRFAVAVDTPLRRQGVALAAKHGLRTQTHLNEQVAEKQFVESTLYPNVPSYTDVYLQDGLLDHRCIVAHCIQMRDEEWKILRDTGSVVAHCPTSNQHLGSGTMPLDRIIDAGLPYAIATDVGASPTVSMLAEMQRFREVHAGHSAAATTCEALYRATRAPAALLDLDRLGSKASLGVLEAGWPMSFIEVLPMNPTDAEFLPNLTDAEAVIDLLLPPTPDQPPQAIDAGAAGHPMGHPYVPGVRRVTLAGAVVHEGADDA